MGRPEDALWNHVKREGKNGWQCEFCRRIFKGTATRIRAHLLGNKGQGIAPCKGEVPDDVKREASGINMGSTSNPQGGKNKMPFPDDSACEDLLNNHSETTSESMNKLLEESKRSESQKGNKRKGQVGNGSSEVYSIKKRAKDMKKSAVQSDLANHIKLEGKIPQLSEEVAEPEKLKPCEGSLTLYAPVTERAQRPLLVGQNFRSNMDKIWKLLNDEKVKIIGVHGKSGAGKTTLVARIHNEIAKTVNFFGHVFWVTVSRDSSISKLQHDIAKRINLTLDEECDKGMKAARLREALKEKKRSVLILDDVWNKIDLNKIGIPLEKDGIKLILTTCSKDVCYRMRCASNDIIEVEHLKHEEAWRLFSFHLGFHETYPTLDRRVLDIAESVARECNGLPLLIKILARTMKGVADIHQWRRVLSELQNSTLSELQNSTLRDEEFFKVLRFSCDRLNDTQLQKCFLYSSLYPKDFKIRCDELIEKFVHEGLISGGGTLEDIYGKGQSMLQKLVQHSLLKICEESGIKFVKMLRSMACWMQPSRRLKNMPDLYERTTDLEVSMQNRIDFNMNRVRLIEAEEDSNRLADAAISCAFPETEQAAATVESPIFTNLSPILTPTAHIGLGTFHEEFQWAISTPIPMSPPILISHDDLFPGSTSNPSYTSFFSVVPFNPIEPTLGTPMSTVHNAIDSSTVNEQLTANMQQAAFYQELVNEQDVDMANADPSVNEQVATIQQPMTNQQAPNNDLAERDGVLEVQMSKQQSVADQQPIANMQQAAVSQELAVNEQDVIMANADPAVDEQVATFQQSVANQQTPNNDLAERVDVLEFQMRMALEELASLRGFVQGLPGQIYAELQATLGTLGSNRGNLH